MILSTILHPANLVKALLLTLTLLFSLAGCASSAGSSVSVVTTTNILADWAEKVGGDHVEVFSLVPAGADPHGFQPGAQDVARVADADLVLSVGLGLEESWLKELLQNAARDPATIVELGEAITPIEFAESHSEEVEIIEEVSHVVHEVEEGEITPEVGLEEIKEVLAVAEGSEEGGSPIDEHGDEHGDADELPAMALAIIEQVEGGEMEAGEAIAAIEAAVGEGEEAHEGHGHGLHDPHFWFDPLRVQVAVNDIAERLSALDPEGADTYRANATAYNAQLGELNLWTEQQVKTVPEGRRLLVTSHDSLGYFANLYGFEVVGVILSITTEVEPSAEDLTHLIEEVKELGVPAVFGETTVSERLATAVATESGVKLVRLYSGSLGLAGSGAETYIEMMRTNVTRITEAMR